MPNRIIREGILTSDRVNSLTPMAELFYRRLMSVVDDFGRYSANPSLLRASCYPLQLDVVKEDSIKKHLAACADAGLIVLFTIAGKAYLEMQDFRQQVRAKESKYPSPDGACSTSDFPSNSSCVADDVQVNSSCVADDVQVNSSCVADEHVDGGVDVDEFTPHQQKRAREGDAFRMSMDWSPSSHFATLARQAGLPVPGGDEFNAGLAEFKAYWLSRLDERTQHEWDHSLIRSLKSDKLRGASPAPKRATAQRPSPGQRTAEAAARWLESQGVQP